MNHFADEERIMAAMRYPEMLAHIQQHDKKRRKVTEVETRFEHGEIAMTIELILFLSNWLRDHTMVIDRRLGDYIPVEQSFNAYLDRLLNGDIRESNQDALSSERPFLRGKNTS